MGGADIRIRHVRCDYGSDDAWSRWGVPVHRASARIDRRWKEFDSSLRNRGNTGYPRVSDQQPASYFGRSFASRNSAKSCNASDLCHHPWSGYRSKVDPLWISGNLNVDEYPEEG